MWRIPVWKAAGVDGLCHSWATPKLREMDQSHGAVKHEIPPSRKYPRTQQTGQSALSLWSEEEQLGLSQFPFDIQRLQRAGSFRIRDEVTDILQNPFLNFFLAGISSLFWAGFFQMPSTCLLLSKSGTWPGTARIWPAASQQCPWISGYSSLSHPTRIIVLRPLLSCSGETTSGFWVGKGGSAKQS